MTASDPENFFAERVVQRAVMRRVRNDLVALRELSERLEPAPVARPQLNSELKALSADLASLASWQPPANFRAILTLNDLHARVFRAQAALWRAMELRALTVWEAATWDPVPLVGRPPPQATPTPKIDMMQNEYRAMAFNISSAAQNETTVRVQIQGLPGGVNPDGSQSTRLNGPTPASGSRSPLRCHSPGVTETSSGFWCILVSRDRCG